MAQDPGDILIIRRVVNGWTIHAGDSATPYVATEKEAVVLLTEQWVRLSATQPRAATTLAPQTSEALGTSDLHAQVWHDPDAPSHQRGAPLRPGRP